MPFDVKGDEPLTDYVQVRLSPSEKRRLRDDAEIAGLTMSELVRRRTFARSVVAAADLVMVRELRRVGGLLKLVHNESRGAYSQKTAAALDALRHCIDSIGGGDLGRATMTEAGR